LLFQRDWDPDRIRAHAERFSLASFGEHMRLNVAQMLDRQSCAIHANGLEAKAKPV